MGDSTLVQILGGTITMDPRFIGKLLHKILELGFYPHEFVKVCLFCLTRNFARSHRSMYWGGFK